MNKKLLKSREDFIKWKNYYGNDDYYEIGFAPGKEEEPKIFDGANSIIADGIMNLVIADKNDLSEKKLNDIDKTELCNRILKICVEHSTRYQEFRVAINYILDSEIAKAEQLLNVIKQVIIGEQTTHTFTKREELKKQLQLAGFNSNQSKNVRSKEYFMQKFANAEEVNND